MEINVVDNFRLLFEKNNNTAYKALQMLQKECEKSDKVYCYMDKLADMIGSDNSYIRTRGLTLIAYNSKWDKDNKIDEIIDEYLKHIEDVKPITARQCIKLLPMIAKNKPELKEDIVSALQKANISIFADSMQPLVYKDIQNSLAEIDRETMSLLRF
ncbi:MAG: SufBD protein [Lachnospiraceae bacterium]